MLAFYSALITNSCLLFASLSAPSWVKVEKILNPEKFAGGPGGRQGPRWVQGKALVGGQEGRSPPKLLKDSNLYTFGTPFLKCIGHVLTLCRIAYQPIMDAVRTVLSVKIDSAGWIWHPSTLNLIIAIF